jgi:hypothetical protein
MKLQRNEFGLTYIQWMKYITKQLLIDKKKLKSLEK